jgi:TRAP-type C4-dicarboxylate transport system permease small subunit
MKLFASIVRKSQMAAAVIIGLILAAMMIIIFAQTFFRYVIFYSLPWSEECSRFLFFALVCLGITVGEAKNAMIRIDNIDHSLSPKMKKYFEMGRLVVEMIVSVLFVIASFDVVSVAKFQKSPAMQLPMHYLYMVLTVGFILTFFTVLLKLIELAKSPVLEKEEA